MRQEPRIVADYDGTSYGVSALEWAAHEAADRGRRLSVISIVGHAGAPEGGRTDRLLGAPSSRVHPTTSRTDCAWLPRSSGMTV